MLDYSKCIIYKLCCKDPNIEEIYIGATCDFKQRKRAHKTDCHNPNRKHYNYYVYQFIRNHGGFENWTMKILEKYSNCKNKLKKKKRTIWIKNLNHV